MGIRSMELDDHCGGARFSDAYLQEENRNVDCPQVTHSSDNRMLPVPVTLVRFGAFELCHSCRMSNLAKVNFAELDCEKSRKQKCTLCHQCTLLTRMFALNSSANSLLPDNVVNEKPTLAADQSTTYLILQANLSTPCNK
ncbi:hypothetical protein T08_2648 [Trichinella sp. T8]|nr:hypothetical protein T08_2648 [Trichinella sp. T8]